MPTLETLVSLAKRRGFIFQNSEIYGGLGSVWDFGPVGVELKRRIKDYWWTSMVQNRNDIEGIDSSILMDPAVWEASGHLKGFSDPLVECVNCHKRFREDEVDSKCPDCDSGLSDPRQFNLMFKTFMGPVEEDAAPIYLRPETAQGIFVNFNNVLTTTRRKIPFGIAQIGKSFRNEITPGNFIFRTREFEQMEMEYFCYPKDSDKLFQEWIEFSMNWFKEIGIQEKNLRTRIHNDEERPHYAKAATDIEYNFPWGWGELETINNRTDYDLKNHMEKSGRDLSYFDESTKSRFIPYVIEPAMGADRTTLAVFSDAYHEEEVNNETRTVLKFDPKISPIEVAVLPLSRNEKLKSISSKVFNIIRSSFRGQFDDTQSIGKRYRRQDEIGTPVCVTIDFDTLDDNSVTIRNRNTMKQVRVEITQIKEVIKDHLETQF